MSTSVTTSIVIYTVVSIKKYEPTQRRNKEKKQNKVAVAQIDGSEMLQVEWGISLLEQ